MSKKKTRQDGAYHNAKLVASNVPIIDATVDLHLGHTALYSLLIEYSF